MELEKLVANSYGSVDLVFAGHSIEIEFAQKSIIKAFELELGWGKYLKYHEDFLKSKSAEPGHIKEQLKSVMNITDYFKYD